MARSTIRASYIRHIGNTLGENPSQLFLRTQGNINAMSKAVLKTTRTEASVDDFINAIADSGQQADARAIVTLMQAATKASPKMWGASIIGFGSQTLKYESGRELDWMIIGFSPRKANTVLYLALDLTQYNGSLAKLGKHKTGKGCLYIKRLSDIDIAVLKKLIAQSVKSHQ